MRFHGLDLNLLVALRALLDERNVTRASERLNLSQAATSNALARLRDHFADPLLVRVGRRMVLTDRARVLLPDLKDVLQQIETCIMAPPNASPKDQVRQVTVMTADAVAVDFAARVTQRLEREAPGIRLVIRPLLNNADLQLDRGGVDLLVIPRQFASKDHPTAPLYEEPFGVISCQQGAWAGQDISVDQYLEATHVFVEIGPERKVPVDRAIFEQAHGRLKSSVSVSSQTIVPWHVVESDRLGTIPVGLARQFAAILPLDAHPLPFDVAPNQIVMQWNTRRDHDAGLRWLRDLFSDVGRDVQRAVTAI
jgi:LysR family transcriptional regulator, nod-box dependent transcriptional activator